MRASSADEYDALGLTTKQTDALGNVTTYTYDGVGNLKTVTESDGRTTTYSYDGMGRVAEMVYPTVGSRPTTTTPSVIWSRWRTPIPAKRT